MTLQLYARRKGWPLGEVETQLSHHRVHSRDCADCESDPSSRVDVFELELRLRGDLTAPQVDRLRQIAGRCPVHRTLTGEVKIRTGLVER